MSASLVTNLTMKPSFLWWWVWLIYVAMNFVLVQGPFAAGSNPAVTALLSFNNPENKKNVENVVVLESYVNCMLLPSSSLPALC